MVCLTSPIYFKLNIFLGCNYAYTMLNDAYKLNAIIIYLQCFQETLENNALLGLFSYLVKQPCFNQLRTKEQLGYIINSQLWRSCGVQGFSITVQSTRELSYINQRIELFIDSIRVCKKTKKNRILFQKILVNRKLTNVVNEGALIISLIHY